MDILLIKSDLKYEKLLQELRNPHFSNSAISNSIVLPEYTIK